MKELGTIALCIALWALFAPEQVGRLAHDTVNKIQQGWAEK